MIVFAERRIFIMNIVALKAMAGFLRRMG